MLSIWNDGSLNLVLPPSDSFCCRVSLIFGGITLISGIIGVPLGSILSQRLKKRYPRCDPLICGLGLFISFPLILGAMLLISKSSWLAFLLMFLGVLSLNCNWAIVGDILLVRCDFLLNYPNNLICRRRCSIFLLHPLNITWFLFWSCLWYF